MSEKRPVRVGIAGLGGYAGSIRQTIASFGHQCSPPVEFVAACDPAMETFTELLGELMDQGVHVYRTFDELLADEAVEAVWLPIPIDLHRPFTEQALAAGKPVMCEKPAAGVIQDVDAMIAARDAANLPVAIGFQSVYDERTFEMKRRILAGEIGRITHTTVEAHWPRDTAYFGRATWAGAMKRGDTWVLDSPANNAISHYINLPLFIMGATPEISAEITRVDAELYRAAEIENYDTCSLRVHVEGGATVLVNYTHACTDGFGPVVTLYGEHGQATIEMDRFTFQRAGEPAEELQADRPTQHSLLDRFAKLVRGDVAGGVAYASLEVARMQSLIVSAASQAAAVVQVPPEQIESLTRPGTDATIHAIRGIDAAIEAATCSNCTLHETGLLPFTQPAQGMDTAGYAVFAGPK